MEESHFKKSEETWDKIAESFDKTRKKPWPIVIDFIKNQQKNKIFADLGCGNGRHLIPAANHFKKVIGIDISSELIKIVEKKIRLKKIDNVELIHSNLINIPIKENKIHSIIYIAALHNIRYRKNRIQSLKEIKRIMKKNGSALISVWSQEQEKFREIFEKKKKEGFEQKEFGDIEIYWRQDKLNIPRFYHLYRENEFKEDIKKTGLKIKKFEPKKIISKKYFDNYFAVVEK